MSEFTDKLREALLSASLPFDESSLAYFEVYKNLLFDWNAHMNLTAIRDEDGIIYKHFVDSLMVLKVVDNFSSLLDVGSGAGFPGVPVKIIKREIALSLIESQKKKATFLEILLERLTFTDAKVYNARAEELARDNLRESFDVVCEREFGKIPINLEVGLPFVKLGGHLLLYKGAKDIEKIDIFKIFIEELGGSIEKIFPYKLNDSIERYIVSIRKEWHTPWRYPRSYSSMLRDLKKWGEFA
ncbi:MULTISPECIES: 16S rRNA (guanine(527)-N(7))-methyltransferase RsmG [Caldisericum]|jgi:16S rRNA (guanine527-N7)-methyltransferase|uniref:Ribosomal RNA small subunit methyltransferase G n=1 Tax=Caldisericum exile TaxID=693075 RepID=A0A2J6WEN4_9BACT|nr:MAG: 16S rRNA (guanine(527)-N(7))-methyltransferase RsmG [Caldisericum exile]